MGRPAGPRRVEAPRRQRLSAALSRACQRPRALYRRLCRLRGGGELDPGPGRGRADRGRLRAPPRGGVDRGRHLGGRAAGVGSISGQYRLRAALRRQGRDRVRLRQRRPRRQAPLRDQPRHRRQHGAARLDRRLQRGRGPLHDLHDAAARASLSDRAGADPEGAGEQDQSDHRRHRWQLRDEIGGL